MKKKFLRGAIVGIAAFFVTFVLHSLHLFRPLEWKSWDARLRLFADPARAGRDIVLILVDQYSLDVYGKQQGLSWPWPREMYAYLINYLQAGKAAACFIDIPMTEGSAIVKDDEKLAGAVAGAGNVFFPIALSTEEKESDENAVGFLRRFSIPGWPVSPPKAADRFRSVTVPLEVFLKTAKGVGNVRVNPDSDGIYRRMPLTFAFRDLVLPSVPLALSEFIGSGPDPSSVPLDETAQMIIRFWGPAGTYRTYPIATLINSWAQMQEGQKPQIPPRNSPGRLSWSASAPSASTTSNPVP